jgi:hypothetical protein
MRTLAALRVAAAALAWTFLLSVAMPLSAQELLPHMESCLDWSHTDGQWGALNNCKGPTTIQFMVLADGPLITQDVPPGSRFNSGAPEPIGVNAWMYTACPVGYTPNIRFVPANADIIIPSHYHCVRQGRPDA